METEKTAQELFDIIDEIQQNKDICNNYGECEGSDCIVFDGWNQVYELEGILNGFNGLTDKPYLPNGKTYNDLYLEAKEELKKNPDHYGVKRAKDQALTWMLWEQHKAQLDEVISIEDYGVDILFSDEYDRCINCGKIIRTSPCSYDWTPPLFIDCEGYACDDCADNYSDYVLDEYKNVQKSIPDSFSMEGLGLVKINKDTYQNGMHYGMDDSPEPIIEKLNAQDIDVYFKVYPSQFYCEFDVYVKTEDQERATQILEGVDTYQGYSTAGNLEKALKSIPNIHSNEGIVYNKVDVSTGTVETRIVSQEEFIKGIKD